MPGLVPGIHVLGLEEKTWMAGTSPAMTMEPVRKFSSSFLLTRCLPFCSSGRLPTLSMPLAKTQALLACSRRAPPINSLAT
jgi:hypothetical protein